MTVISVMSIASQFAMRQVSRKIAWRSSSRPSPRFHRCLLLLQNSTNERPHARSVPNSACNISNPTAYRSGCCRSLTTSGGPRFPPIAEAASVPFPGRDMRVSRVGFGSPWIGAASDRGLELSRALSDGGCNLVQLTSEVKTVRKHDEAGKPLPVPEWPARSWETRTLENIEITRNDLCLLWELPVSNKPVKEALSPTRGMEHLDRLLIYHGLSYIDVFLFEIPPFEGGEDAVNEYRRHTGEAIRLALTEFTQLAGDRIKALGFSWKVNPHIPYPGRAPDSPLSDVMELRDLLTPSKPLVAMFPAGVACGVTVDGLEVSNGGIMGLPESSGVFQIGTNITHARRPDGRPFRLVDVYPRPIEDIMPDLKSMLGMTIHMEREYSKRFVEDDGQKGLKGESGDGDASPSRSPLPPKNDVSWGHILANNQHQLPGLDEWEMIRDCQIKPTVNRALDTLRIRGEAEGEWGFLYRSTLGSLMSELSAVMEVRKAHQLAEVSKFMDVIPRKGRDGGLEGCDTADSSRSGETVVSRCIAAALATGVDCVLDEEYSASREAGRITGISAVSPAEVKKLYKEFRMPE